jgi:RNA polymerase sigma-70 factor (ECF subfamily)
MPTDLDEAATAFQTIRPRLFGIAYRMLGSATEADDVVQEAWLRWQGTDRASILDPTAFLSTVTTRIAINAATSARARRESYIGPWLPEPVATGDDPSMGAERGEALDLAVLFLMERLTPVERAVYVLREAFDYPFAQIAEILETTEANARQLAHRARSHIAEQRSVPTSAEDRRRLLSAFIEAARSGDLERLEQILTEDVTAYADGGGVVAAGPRPILGRDRVARFIAGGARKFLADAEFTLVEVNGQPAMLVTVAGQSPTLGMIATRGDRIQTLLFQRNPEKLGILSQDGGLSGLPE